MPYDESLAERIRPNFLPRIGVREKSMFGGIAFLVHGNMCCGIWKDLLVIRLSVEEAKEALQQKHTHE